MTLTSLAAQQHRAEAPSSRPFGRTEQLTSLSDDDVVRLTALGLATLEVAHDLGNLLQVAGSAVRLIDRTLRGARKPELNPLVSSALVSIERATTLSRRILDSGRPRPVGSEIVYLDALLAEMEEVIALAAGPHVQVIRRMSDIIPAIACHRGDLENVVLNLVVNARDAMSDGGTLILCVDRDVSDVPATALAKVVFSVSDTGCGMSPAVAAQAFKPFFTTKPRDLGTGLGLALVGAFAGRLGGSAEISSADDMGTTVTLRLPSCGG